MSLLTFFELFSKKTTPLTKKILRPNLWAKNDRMVILSLYKLFGEQIALIAFSQSIFHVFMENHFCILSRLGFILNGFCSPLNVFLSYHYFLFLAPWPWLLGPRPTPLPPSSPRLPQSLPLAGLGPGMDLGRFWRGCELSSTINSSYLIGDFWNTHTVATGGGEVVARSAARSPRPHAPGARMTVVYTNSLK